MQYFKILISFLLNKLSLPNFKYKVIMLLFKVIKKKKPKEIVS